MHIFNKNTLKSCKMFNKYVHVLVTIDADFIDARFNYET